MHKRLQRVLTALAMTGLAVPGTLATTTGTAAADVPGAIATVQACVAAASNPASSLPACTSLAAQLTAIFSATPAGVSPIVDQIETTIQTSAFQTLGGVLADADNCINATDPTCASVLQTVANVEQALVLLAQREEIALLTFTQDCVTKTNATCGAVFDDIQTLVNLSEQEAAFVAVTAAECIGAASGGGVQVPTDQIIVGGVPDPSCDTLLGQLPALLGDIGVVVGDLQACIAGAAGTPCQTAEEAAVAVIGQISQNVAKLLQAAQECASGANPTCASAVSAINQTAAAIQDAVNKCAAQDPGSACASVIGQAANALNYSEGIALTCSGLSAEDSCTPLEEATKLIVPMIGDQDFNTGPADVMFDSTNGDVVVGTTRFFTVPFVRTAVTPVQLPGTDNLTTVVGFDNFDTPADALAAGDLNAAATAKTYKGGCDQDSTSNTQPDQVYSPIPIDNSDSTITLHYNDVGYQVNFARTLVNSSTGVKETSWQINECVYGGARTYHHYRLWMTSGGMVEYYTPDQASQIDYGYAVGSNDSNNTDSLGFELDLGRVLKINPHIGQSKTGNNTGAAFAPPPYYDQKTDPLYQESHNNEVQGWWREYHPWYVPPSNAGSTDYQSSTLSGLFEFGRVTQQHSTPDFSAYAAIYCTQTRGCK
jgi:hypothetical protein